MALPCKCSAICPDAPHCACVENAETHVCEICDCGEIEDVLLHDGPAKTFKPTDMISLCVRDKELGDLAAFVGRITDAEILVPASQMRKPITTELENVSVGDALEQLGLVAAPPGQESY